MEKLTIYLGDLTYDTVTISNEVFPLNVAYVASYCIKKFGNAVNIELFKYPQDLERAIKESPPDILGLSNYCWNKRLGLEIFRILSSYNPNSLKIMGGPNFPADIPSQQKFMDDSPEIDVYVPIDGETGFSNIVEKALQANSPKDIKEKVLENTIEGCISRDVNGKLQYSNPVIRISQLDEIPSPYLTGLMDKFFDGNLSPMVQTNRGCPFRCTFCTDGSNLVQQVNKFSLDRVNLEPQYV